MFLNIDVYVCDFEVCDIGMKIKIKRMVVSGPFWLNNEVYIELLVSIIDLPLYTFISDLHQYQMLYLRGYFHLSKTCYSQF